MLHPTLTIALKAARNASDIILRSAGFLDRITFTEKSTHDYVSEVDRLAEKEIIHVLRQSFPQHGILGEESGYQAGKNEDYLWIIDPLDGTTNFKHGVPHFSVSIALQHKGKIEHGIIYDPVRQEIFTASRGHGARMNDQRLRVSKTATLNYALLGTGFPYHDYKLLPQYLKIFQEFLPIASGIRRAGSAALDLAYVAAGRFDGYWEFNLKAWDLAAGTLIVKEAGGLVSDTDGSEHYLETGNIIAGNPKIFKYLLQTIKPIMDEIKK